jgi:hypothetical protein
MAFSSLSRRLFVALIITFASPAAWAQGVSLTATSSVAFAALNPSTQPITPGSNTIVATVTINTPKNHDNWYLTIRTASSNFTGTSGLPISVTNASWTATATVIDGQGTATAQSGQNLSTSSVLVATGDQGKKGPFIVQVVLTLKVANSWNYDADTYLQNLVLTASAD